MTTILNIVVNKYICTEVYFYYGNTNDCIDQKIESQMLNCK